MIESPATVKRLVALLNVNAVLPATIPLSLNKICVLDPGDLMFAASILPINHAAETFPLKFAVVRVIEFAHTLLPLLCMVRILLATPLPKLGSA
jgi:hypothetical protein